MARAPEIIDGIECYCPERGEASADYRAEGLDKLYAAERWHFWFRHRIQVILQRVRSHLPAGASFMEIGAGTGGVARKLVEAGKVGEAFLREMDNKADLILNGRVSIIGFEVFAFLVSRWCQLGHVVKAGRNFFYAGPVIWVK